MPFTKTDSQFWELSQVPRASIIDKMLQDQTYLVQVHTVSSKSEAHTQIYALLLENL